MFQHWRRWTIAVLIVLCLAAARSWFAEALAVPMDPDRLVFYSVDGRRDEGMAPLGVEQFHGFEVLGKIEVTDPAQRRQIMSALRRGMAEWTMESKCFWPRHALQATANGRIVEYVICFECNEMRIARDGTSLYHSISRSPQKLFNEILEAASIPITPKR